MGSLPAWQAWPEGALEPDCERQRVQGDAGPIAAATGWGVAEVPGRHDQAALRLAGHSGPIPPQAVTWRRSDRANARLDEFTVPARRPLPGSRARRCRPPIGVEHLPVRQHGQPTASAGRRWGELGRLRLPGVHNGPGRRRPREPLALVRTQDRPRIQPRFQQNAGEGRSTHTLQDGCAEPGEPVRIDSGAGERASGDREAEERAPGRYRSRGG